jgi:hypothetical protein
MGKRCGSRHLLSGRRKSDLLRKSARDLRHLQRMSEPIVNRDAGLRRRDLRNASESL